MGGAPDVLSVAAFGGGALHALVARYRACLVDVPVGNELPGSYWGAPEAGLCGNRIYVSAATPLHSLLHELSHFVCMSPRRRAALLRDAGGDDAEECAVCYLQILLADELPGFGRERCLADMDAWGYSFREGSARVWFHGDGIDARVWLRAHALIADDGRPTWRLRVTEAS